MKSSIARKIIAVSTGALLLFLVSMLFVFYKVNSDFALDNAINLLGVFETQMQDGKYTSDEQYKVLVKYSPNAKNIRVSVIDINGSVLADTLSDDTENMENHLNRKEVQDALNKSLGRDTRKSDTFNVDYIYVARLVFVENRSVILRIAVPVNSINSYLIGALVAGTIIFVVVLIIIYFLTKKIASDALVPIKLIKNKLDSVIADGANMPMNLTKYDEINVVLQDIDMVSERLSSNLVNYQKEKEKLNFILENIQLGVLALDSSKTIIASNKISQDYLNFNSEVNVNKITRDRIVLDNIDIALKEKELIIFDSSFTKGRTLETRLIPIESQDIKLIIILSDVTDVRKLAKEKQEFFVNASHELNTPLSSILGYSEMQLQSDKLNKPFIETINKEAERMKMLILDMLKISELEGKKEIVDEKIDLKKIIEQVVISASPKAEKKKIKITSILESCTITADQEKMTEVVSNLLDNAIKYTNDGGAIEIVLKRQKDKVLFKIKDNGVGIASKDLSRIFERFYRTDKGRSPSEGGTGLGLAIVKHICNHYNAPISINSKEGTGTEIAITFQKLRY